MAMCVIYSCRNCDYQVEAWDEGNPYIEINGERTYFYHPEPFPDPPNSDEFKSSGSSEKPIVGNAPDHVCMDCGEILMLDSGRDTMTCARCRSSKLVEAFEMANQQCPKCGGTLNEGEPGGIS